MRLKAPLTSGDIALRNLEVADAGEPYASWMRDPEILRFLEVRHRPNPAADLADYIKAQIESPSDLFLAICLKESGRHIGNVKLGFISNVHRRGDVGILVGDRTQWGKGYAAQAIDVLCGHAFSALGIAKVTASCHADNVGSIKSFLRAGFVEEGRRRAHYFRDGGWHDEVMIARFADGAAR